MPDFLEQMFELPDAKYKRRPFLRAQPSMLLANWDVAITMDRFPTMLGQLYPPILSVLGPACALSGDQGRTHPRDHTRLP